MKKTFIILILLEVCLGIGGFVWVWKYSTPTTPDREPPPSFKIKHQSIENEIAELKDHPWAGCYRDGMTSLTLAPQNGFTWAPYYHGMVEWNGTYVKLFFKTPLPSIYPSEFTPIPWGERMYLVAADKILDFCNAVNSGDISRLSVSGRRFFLREGDENKKVHCKPEVPEAFQKYLLDEPVEAAIVSLKDIQVWNPTNPLKRRQVTTFVVDKGKNDGLLPGMILYITGPGNIYGQGEIKRVELTSSEWEFERPTDGWEHWRLSTRPKRDSAENLHEAGDN